MTTGSPRTEASRDAHDQALAPGRDARPLTWLRGMATVAPCCIRCSRPRPAARDPPARRRIGRHANRRRGPRGQSTIVRLADNRSQGRPAAAAERRHSGRGRDRSRERGPWKRRTAARTRSAGYGPNEGATGGRCVAPSLAPGSVGRGLAHPDRPQSVASRGSSYADHERFFVIHRPRVRAGKSWPGRLAPGASSLEHQKGYPARDLGRAPGGGCYRCRCRIGPSRERLRAQRGPRPTGPATDEGIAGREPSSCPRRISVYGGPAE